MKAIGLLASSLNRKDEQPNQELAIEIIRSKRADWVKELVDHLHDKNKNIQSDCIKVLYEIGERGSGDLIAPYCEDFGKLLDSKNNRLVWGAMTALDTITAFNPAGVYALLSIITRTLDKGSVITIDHGVGLLAKLSGIPEYAAVAFPLLMEQLKKCPPKQLPMYAEKSIVAIHARNKESFTELIQSRMPEMEKESQRTRLRKCLKTISRI